MIPDPAPLQAAHEAFTFAEVRRIAEAVMALGIALGAVLAYLLGWLIVACLFFIAFAARVAVSRIQGRSR